MVTNKRKKVQKYRGHTTHGGGHRKKRRGFGSHGGKGNAGTGKRAGHHKQGVVLGRSGFLPRREKTHTKAINLGYFTLERLEKLVHIGKIKKEGNIYTVDLNKIGFTKLLSTGNLGGKVNFEHCQCSAKAEEKIKAVGGVVKISKPGTVGEQEQ